jgi:hypothetical protein
VGDSLRTCGKPEQLRQSAGKGDGYGGEISTWHRLGNGFRISADNVSILDILCKANPQAFLHPLNHLLTMMNWPSLDFRTVPVFLWMTPALWTRTAKTANPRFPWATNIVIRESLFL